MITRKEAPTRAMGTVMAERLDELRELPIVGDARADVLAGAGRHVGVASAARAV